MRKNIRATTEPDTPNPIAKARCEAAKAQSRDGPSPSDPLRGLGLSCEKKQYCVPVISKLVLCPRYYPLLHPLLCHCVPVIYSRYLHARRPVPEDGLIHHSDRGVQYLAMSYTQRLAEVSSAS